MNKPFFFDRTVSDELIDALKKGPAQELVKLARKKDYDLQLRRDQKAKTPPSWATLYYGLTALLNLEAHQGMFRVTAHPKYMAMNAFDPAWAKGQPAQTLWGEWPRIAHYIREIASEVEVNFPQFLSREGPVHAAISSRKSDAYRVINREATPAFRDKATKQRLLATWVKPFNDILDVWPDAPKWWPKEVKVGASLDFLAVDIGGRLALIEAKASTASASELAKVAVQVGAYAEMYAQLLRDRTAIDAMGAMLAQRIDLGLNRRGVLHLRNEGTVVPVVAIGPRRPSDEVQNRMWKVAAAIAPAHSEAVDPIEVWYLDESGRIREVERAEDREPASS